MKKLLLRILFFFALALAGSAAHGQNPNLLVSVIPPNDTVKVTFSFTIRQIGYLANYISDVSVLRIMSVAIQGKRGASPDEVVHVTVPRKVIRSVFQSLGQVPEGIGATPNSELIKQIWPTITQDTLLAKDLQSILAINSKYLEGAVQTGLSKLRYMNGE